MLVGSYSSLSHCLLNLIKNAREAMQDGGTIHVLWEGNDSRATVTVRDHGAGIPEEDMAQIFEPFFSTKKQGTGPGPGDGARDSHPALGHGGNSLDGGHGDVGIARVAAGRYCRAARPGDQGEGRA